MDKIVEWRGVKNLYAAKVLTDTASGMTFGTPFYVAGTAEISKAANSSTAAHFYDNKAAVVIRGKGADVRTINTSALPLDVLAEITGQYYNSSKGLFVGGKSTPAYYALGYVTEDTDGNEVFVWNLKGMFNIPDQTNSTKNDGTDANGQTLTYTSVFTNYSFTENANSATETVVDMGLGLAAIDAGGGVIIAITDDSWFAQVVTPDMIVTSTSYTLRISPAYQAPITILKNGTLLGTYTGTQGQSTTFTEYVYSGDQLKISVSGGTVSVNSDEWFSGDIHIVTGNVTVTSTASE